LKRMGKKRTVIMILALMGTLIAGCGNSGSNSGKETGTAVPSASTAAPGASQTAAPESEAASGTRIFKDWTGHEVEIPVQPERIIFHGETPGDLLALGIKPIGVMKNGTQGTIVEEKLKDVEDVGFPLSLEKSIELAPDLIIFSNSDEAQYESIAKVASTVTFDTFAPIQDRMRTLGEMLGKKEEAEAWIADHTAKSQAMWQKLRDAGVKAEETATVFTMYPGNRLFVMAGAGLPQFLYDNGGFKVPDSVQQVIDDGMGFVEISLEALPEYAGDRIFVLTPIDPDAVKSTNELTESGVWKGLPAVKNGYVYTFEIAKASSDALSREWLVEELPKTIIK